MIPMLLTVIGLVLNVGLRYFISQWKISEEYKKSNQFSSFVYFCAVAYFIYKVNKYFFSHSSLIIYSMVSVLGSMITVDIMIFVIWDKIEYLVLEVFPEYVHKNLSKNGYGFETDIPFVLLLWTISFSFVMIAHKSDSILDNLLKLASMDDEGHYPIEVVEFGDSSDDGSGEPQFTDEGIAYIGPPPINLRTLNTLPSDFRGHPPRRSVIYTPKNGQCLYARPKITNHI